MASSMAFAIIILMAVIVVLLAPLDPLDVARQARSCIKVERGGGGAAGAGAVSLIAAGVSCIADSASKSRTVLGSISAALLAFGAPRPAFPFPGSSEEVLEEVPDGWPGPPPHRTSLRWFAPFFSSGGYSSEALSFVSYLKDIVQVGIVQHGDSVNENYLRGLPVEVHAMLRDATRRRLPHASAIEVCHSEPGAWSTPRPKYQTSECPTSAGVFSVGRTMFETDRLPDGWSSRLNALDEIWVPARFHVDIFLEGGVRPEKLHIVPEAVDTVLFDPSAASPLDIMVEDDDSFKFLSVFKWEARKGWDVLLRAYFEEFTPTDKVSLYIRTYAYHSASNFEEMIAEFAAKELGKAMSDLPRVVVLSLEMPLSDMPRLYKGADCFVLPSRGEGWGRPHIEAMSMGLPAIATNWSGNTEFMLEDNSYLIPINGLEPVPNGAFQGHLWASPSVQGLRHIMRQVKENPGEARAVGRKGMAHVREKYSQESVGKVVLRHLHRIEKGLVSGKLKKGGIDRRGAEL